MCESRRDGGEKKVDVSVLPAWFAKKLFSIADPEVKQGRVGWPHRDPIGFE